MINLDNTDMKILNILQKNSREPLKSIAEQCYISSPSANARIKKLEKSIIKNYRLVVDYEKLGYQIKAFVNVSLTTNDKNAFIKLVKKIPNVLEVNNITGDYDFILKVLFKNVHDLEKFLVQLKPFGNTNTNIVFTTQVENRGMIHDEESYET
jgi:Lrp/AsnC family leucine-responsive transcriptional regulator